MAKLKAGEGVVTLTLDNQLKSGLDSAKGMFESWGKGVMALGASVAAAGAVVTAPFLQGLSVFSAWRSSVRTGMRDPWPLV